MLQTLSHPPETAEADVIAALGADKLRVWREAQGLSMRVLADLLREHGADAVSAPTICRIEQAASRPSLDLLDALVRASGGAIRADHFLAPDAARLVPGVVQ